MKSQDHIAKCQVILYDTLLNKPQCSTWKCVTQFLHSNVMSSKHYSKQLLKVKYEQQHWEEHRDMFKIKY